MSAAASEPKDKSRMLFPHQVEFVDTVFSSSSKRVVILSSEPGLGKTFAIAHAAGRLLRESADARVLVLCPAAIRILWSEEIKGEGVPTLIVDRYKFRERLETNAKEDFWPLGAAVILSDDFAKQSDIQESLASVDWDMVVADEAHRYRSAGARADVLERVAEQAGRVVLVLLQGLSGPSGFPSENSTVVVWRREELVEDKKSKPKFVPHPFTRSGPELDLSNLIKRLCVRLEDREGMHKGQLERSLASSPVALEAHLRRYADASEKLEDVRDMASHALKALDDILVDTKLDAFMRLVDELTNMRAQSKICVITNTQSTLYYLAAEIEQRDIHFKLITGSTSWDRRQELWGSFVRAGGILLTTLTVMRGMDGQAVEDVIIYDLPFNPSTLERLFYVLLPRFDRYGRKISLTIHMVTPQLEMDQETHELDVDQATLEAQIRKFLGIPIV